MRDVGGVRGVFCSRGVLGVVRERNPDTVDRTYYLRPSVGAVVSSTYLTHHMPI